jgi:hypothetical protein
MDVAEPAINDIEVGTVASTNAVVIVSIPSQDSPTPGMNALVIDIISPGCSTVRRSFENT